MHFSVEPFFYFMVNFVREGYEHHMGIVVIGHIEIETLRRKRVHTMESEDEKGGQTFRELASMQKDK